MEGVIDRGEVERVTERGRRESEDTLVTKVCDTTQEVIISIEIPTNNNSPL